MKNILIIALALFTSLTFAQNDKKLTLNKETNQIDAVYYHENGKVSQTGTFTADGKLDGKWISFDEAGEKTTVAFYKDGKKVGKWIHWIEGKKKVVSYENNVATL
ncbi:toxin-antitoxin system YwqK family antitoxin [Algibacter miyuki]|uniref:Toxin-antitoxin system YwqK family antitoxin n=1 Tax=Algibacter miyuki TaxID=1306933 RepID=A0ABV5GWT8_9FLAO|nr:nicotinic acid mononucleotide adenyltransferase [Algibacter miyuki]MDN3665295.1 nicotinic acid mononucleotide adenyltransferase [Algibacter miyuki]